MGIHKADLTFGFQVFIITILNPVAPLIEDGFVRSQVG